MGQALYRKYRSKSLSEIIGQEHITDTLEQALKSGRISHAYLFTGPRGVGKTSIARILAHEINDLPYDDDSSHIDIIEIDAASNRRIDEIRELREKVYVAPTSAKYKVYIIDEVHMLTREAFNALLKTLEEPPAHVVFILATTDAHKLPETIVSRTQRFNFRPVEHGKVVAHLKAIAKKEKISVDDEALALLASHGEGSFRDSISLLDQASSHGRAINLATVQQLLGIPPAEATEQLLDSLTAADSLRDVAQKLQAIYAQGYQAAAVAKQLAQEIRTQLMNGDLRLDSTKALLLLGQLIEVPAAHNPERYLEIVLLATIDQPAASLEPSLPVRKAAETQPQAVKPAAAKPPVKTAPQEATASKTQTETPAEAHQPAAEAKPATVAVAPTAGGTVLDDALWPQILGALKQKYNTLYGVVRMAQPDFSVPGKLELAFAFAFHQKRINDAKNRQILSDIILQVSGHAVQIDCVLNKTLAVTPAKAATPKKEADSDLSTISNIFGGGELLES